MGSLSERINTVSAVRKKLCNLETSSESANVKPAVRPGPRAVAHRGLRVHTSCVYSVGFPSGGSGTEPWARALGGSCGLVSSALGRCPWNL